MNPDSHPISETSREMMLRYLDGTLPQAQVDELSAQLKGNPALRRDFARLLLQQVQLSEIGQEDNAFAEMRRESVSANPARVIEHTPALELFPTAPWYRAPAVWGTAGLALAASLVLGLFLWFSDRTAVATLAKASPGVVVERNGQPLAAAVGLSLQPGDRLKTPANGVAEFKYSGEETTVRLRESTTLVLDGSGRSKRLSLERGATETQAAPQSADEPMLIETAHATARVLGTQLLVASDAVQTRLEVWTGKVRFQNKGQASVVEVGTGHFAVAGTGSVTAARPLFEGTGTILRESWVGIPGDSVSNLVADLSFPQSPTATDTRSDFETPANWGDNYGARLRGYLRPPVSGTYTFTLEAESAGELWMSLDEGIGHSIRVAEAKPRSSVTALGGGRNERTVELQLRAGGKYYIEAMHKAGVGSDRLAVMWKIPGGDQGVIPGIYLTPYSPAPNAPVAAP